MRAGHMVRSDLLPDTVRRASTQPIFYRNVQIETRKVVHAIFATTHALKGTFVPRNVFQAQIFANLVKGLAEKMLRVRLDHTFDPLVTSPQHECEPGMP